MADILTRHTEQGRDEEADTGATAQRCQEPPTLAEAGRSFLEPQRTQSADLGLGPWAADLGKINSATLWCGDAGPLTSSNTLFRKSSSSCRL